jgi:hypothetical protein
LWVWNTPNHQFVGKLPNPSWIGRKETKTWLTLINNIDWHW